MSGSSLDGIDAVLVDFDHAVPHTLAALTHRLDCALREDLLVLSVNRAAVTLDQVASLDVRVAHAHAEAAEALLAMAQIDRQRVRAVGMHGQTIAHHPHGATPYSWQLGDGNALAERLRIPVVCDFRRRDVAAGGQGAPLVPLLHEILFRHPNEDRAGLNLGGIANLTLLPADPLRPVLGFDCGPANSLLDLHAQASAWGQRDDEGRHAAGGCVIESTLKRLLAHPFFAQMPPKSTHRDAFGYAWAAADGLAPQDLAATLSELTAISVTRSLQTELPGCQRVIVCGGGIHNHDLLSRIRAKLGRCQLSSSAEFGADPDYVEALAFALLAKCRLELRAGSLAGVTGAQGTRVLGALYAG